MNYFDSLTEAMTLLGQDPRVMFVGQTVKWDGHALFKTLKGVPDEKRLEFPVAEDFQMGFSTGLALQGIIPLTLFPRWDFLLLAANQLVNHLDKIPEVSYGKMRPNVIIRTSVGSTLPLDPGPQHRQDHTKAFKLMCKNVDIVDLEETEQIIPEYLRALHRTDGRSTLLVEHANYYNSK